MSNYVVMYLPNGKATTVHKDNADKFRNMGYKLGASTSSGSKSAIERATGGNTKIDSYTPKPITTGSSSSYSNNIPSSTSNKNTPINTSNTKYNTNVYDQYGNRHSGTVKDGITYLEDGSRVPIGWTVNTRGGYYRMGDDGKGYKVDGPPVPQKSSNMEEEPIKNNNMDEYLMGIIESLMGQQNQGPSYDEIYKMVMDNMPKYELPPTMTHGEAQM